MILFIDTETTGLPSRYAEIGDQPYLVQIAAVLCDDARQPVAELKHVIRPDGWSIPHEATAIHGLTTKYCESMGIPLEAALRELLAMWSQAERVIAYNVSFDNLIIQFSAQRAGFALPQRDLYCAMREAAKLISNSGRWMKLGAAYRCFFNKDFDNAHDAMADVQACMAIYYALQDERAPMGRLTGEVKGISSAKLQRALNGAKEIEEHQELLNSVIRLHCNPLRPTNWTEIATQEKPQPPVFSGMDESVAAERLKSYRPNLFMRLLELDGDRIASLQCDVEAARIRDLQRHEAAVSSYKTATRTVDQHRRMAKRVLAGDLNAYNEVLDNCDIGASPILARNIIHSFVSASRIEVFANLNPTEVIPEDTKTLLASGRVSVKKAKKKEFTSLYQDHLCSAALRIARDFMALLPIRKVLIHGLTPGIDPATGHPCERCVLSCLLTRDGFEKIEFEQVDPTDCLTSFQHVMRISKGLLQEVVPLQFLPR